MPVMTGLSGNEIYCLHLKGLRPANWSSATASIRWASSAASAPDCKAASAAKSPRSPASSTKAASNPTPGWSTKPSSAAAWASPA